MIPSGIVLALAGTAVYTQIGADTSYALLGAALFLIGLGLGSTIVPSMAVAFQSVPREVGGAGDAARSTSIQRIAGSIGTALLAVVLQRSISARIPGAGGSLESVQSGLRRGRCQRARRRIRRDLLGRPRARCRRARPCAAPAARETADAGAPAASGAAAILPILSKEPT